MRILWWSAVALVVSTSTARAEIVIPVDRRVGPAVEQPDYGGICGQYIDIIHTGNPHFIANLDSWMAMLAEPAAPAVTASGAFPLQSLDVADHNNGCKAYGDFTGGAVWPQPIPSGVGVARFRGPLNVPGPADQPVTWTIGAAGNDAARVLIGGIEVATPNWGELNWKQFRWVTFAQPGTYPIEVQWSTNHGCELDPLELMMATHGIEGYDGFDCQANQTLAESCSLGLRIPPELQILKAPYLMVEADGGWPAAYFLDSDGDSVSDALEGNICDTSADSDKDGTADELDTDSDGDGVSDLVEAGDTDAQSPPRDSDKDGIPDLRDSDSDGDGVCDGLLTDGRCQPGPDRARLDVHSCGDADRDDCDDCSVTGVDGLGGSILTDGPDTDADGLCDKTDEDVDGDQVLNVLDNCPNTKNRSQVDSDGDKAGDLCDEQDDAAAPMPAGGGCGTTARGGLLLLLLGWVMTAMAAKPARRRAGRS